MIKNNSKHLLADLFTVYCFQNRQQWEFKNKSNVWTALTFFLRVHHRSVCAWFQGDRPSLSISRLLALGAVLALGSGQFLPLQGFLHLCVVVQSLPHRVNDVLLHNESRITTFSLLYPRIMCHNPK